MLAFGARGMALGERIAAYFLQNGTGAGVTRCPEGGLSDWTEAHFSGGDALIFVGSCGIAVRAIAPYVRSKTSDPAVIVIDETGTYVISLLSGHLGGANRLAAELAGYLGAIPVITTATDAAGVLAIDVWAQERGLSVANPERIKWIAARLLAGETIRAKSVFPMTGRPPKEMEFHDDVYDVLITYRTRGRAEALRLIAPAVTLGIGCKKGTDAGTLTRAYALMLKKAGCHPLAVREACSIDLKANEPGILEFCQSHGLPYRTFSAEELRRVPGKFSGSAFVESVTGVDNVCERSAVLGSGPDGRLLLGKDAGAGVTMALAIASYTLRLD